MQCYARLHIEIILAAEDLQLLSQSVHRSIFAQFSPAVKSESCNFQSILLVILDLADSGACAIPVDGDGVDDGNEYPMVIQFPGDWFVVSSSYLHVNARIFTECEDLIRQTLQTDCIAHDMMGVRTTSPIGRRIATVLLPLETSIPTAFICCTS